MQFHNFCWYFYCLHCLCCSSSVILIRPSERKWLFKDGFDINWCHSSSYLNQLICNSFSWYLVFLTCLLLLLVDKMLLLTRESLGLSIVWVRTVILTGRCYQVEHRLVTERWLESTATDTDSSLHDHHQPDNWRNHRFLLARIISSIKINRDRPRESIIADSAFSYELRISANIWVHLWALEQWLPVISELALYSL